MWQSMRDRGGAPGASRGPDYNRLSPTTAVAMRYQDLREFLTQLERLGELKRVSAEVDPRLEMTEICDRVLRAGGPAVLFEHPKGSAIPVLANLFGTPRRVALGGREATTLDVRVNSSRMPKRLRRESVAKPDAVAARARRAQEDRGRVIESVTMTRADHRDPVSVLAEMLPQGRHRQPRLAARLELPR